MNGQAKKDCQSCFYVLGGKVLDGKVLTTERCKKHRAGPNPMHTHTVLHRVTMCGPDRKNWTPKV